MLHDTTSYITEAIRTLTLQVTTATWVVTHMFSKSGVRYMKYATLIYLCSNLLEQLAPYFFGKLVAGHSTSDDQTQLLYLCLIGGSWLAGIVLERFGHMLREWGWNENARSVLTNLSREWFLKTPGEIMQEDRDIGANQIESSNEKMHQVQHTIFFELTEVMATLVTCLALITVVDWRTGVLLSCVLWLNIMVMFLTNHYMHKKMKTIDREIREIHNRLVEFWHNAIIVIAGAREESVLTWLRDESQAVYWNDYLLWGRWFTLTDGARSFLTNLSLTLIVYYSYQDWSVETLVAIFGWLLIFRAQLWRIGNIQRTLAKETERLHALRQAFAEPPAFDQRAGATYRKENEREDRL